MDEQLEQCYTVTFRNYPTIENYVYAATIREAIQTAADLMFEDGHSTPYLAPRARATVYKEWMNAKEQYKNNGDFIK